MEKSIHALKKLVEHRNNLIATFRDKNQSWHLGEHTLSSDMAEGLADFLSDEVQYLEKIIQSLEDKKPKCRHPKKYRDKCGKTWYCMNCNSDLNITD